MRSSHGSKNADTGYAAVVAAEAAWIQETIKQIIWRLGDQRSPANLPPITMADLPRL
jgi:hypothetical protein